jgi:tRNA-splicing ligase RtcB
MTDASTVKIQQIDTYRWRIPRQGQMRVDGLVFASAALMQAIRQDQRRQQVANVVHLPGIVDHSIEQVAGRWQARVIFDL